MKQVFRRLAFLLVLLAVLLSVCYMLWPHSFADLQPECDSVTILRSDTAEDYPFAFWYEDDPGGGCIRFLTETECERLMGLPEGWTKYGADGREICSTNRYATLGNAIALPCAEYIMAGIAEVMG